MNKLYRIFSTTELLAGSLAEEIAHMISRAAQKKKITTIAVSGGNTPRHLFQVLVSDYSSAVDWNMIKLFWVDERCVPPDHPESNYGMTKKILLDNISMRAENIFRIKGEDDPEQEALRYSDVINQQIRRKNNLPAFDIILLGMGDDGHTASIFPGNEKLLSSAKICEVACHPVTNQKRITLTGKVINNSESIFFHVTGKSKAMITDEIFRNSEDSGKYPASHISSVEGSTIWFLDYESGRFIS